MCFKIESGHRAGIVGRTGSGKSTLFQAVYRFVDTHSGEILIDGVHVRYFVDISLSPWPAPHARV